MSVYLKRDNSFKTHTALNLLYCDKQCEKIPAFIKILAQIVSVVAAVHSLQKGRGRVFLTVYHPSVQSDCTYLPGNCASRPNAVTLVWQNI